MAPAVQHDTLGGIASRLGAAALAKRLATEREREDEARRWISPKWTFAKLHVFRPVQASVLKCLGLWGRGRREMLEPVVRTNHVFLGDALPAEFDGFTVLHLSDPHIDIDDSIAESVARVVAPLDYDICAFTGDYRSRTVGPMERATSLMAKLRPAFKTDVFAVLGNHDPIGMVPELERAGYRVLLNESAILRRGDAVLAIAGIDDPVIFETSDVGRALAGLPAGCVKILLSHSARVAEDAAAAGVSLLLAGHTHGGQICLPGGRALLRNEKLPGRFLRGPWAKGALQGYTTAGCGASGLPCRLNCPAEVVLHVLHRGPAIRQ